ncbi:MepB family protein [Brumimicrobium oceani]|uniref:MepB family protein n=1 Tax=Brumimicrobium oceani TaxID=2100725 RepID=A0A2U2XE70_9FLAO|nr:MepB family protein [Brumimicrobium oceani]PWH86102.1 MepB family protein [Brumimicrobium oceani]
MNKTQENIKPLYKPSELELLVKKIFIPSAIRLTGLSLEKESKAYLAYTFLLNGRKSIFRKAKITPTKTGQFVAIWKRNKEGITAPYSIFDSLEYMIIFTEKEQEKGVFIFPKEALHQNKILSDEKLNGKRGIRVYPPWDEPKNNQAMKTQIWQKKYFLHLNDLKANQTRQKEILYSICE